MGRRASRISDELSTSQRATLRLLVDFAFTCHELRALGKHAEAEALERRMDAIQGSSLWRDYHD